MYRKMRRFKQELSNDEALKILNDGNCGVLSLMDDYPYSVPLSYIYYNNKIYFHSAKEGHKIDLIKKNSKASFCVIEKNDIIKEEYTTYFRSIIAFGDVRLIENKAYMREVMEKLALKFNSSDSLKSRENAINKEIGNLVVIEFDIKHLTGKEAIELTKEKNIQIK